MWKDPRSCGKAMKWWHGWREQWDSSSIRSTPNSSSTRSIWKHCVLSNLEVCPFLSPYAGTRTSQEPTSAIELIGSIWPTSRTTNNRCRPIRTEWACKAIHSRYSWTVCSHGLTCQPSRTMTQTCQILRRMIIDCLHRCSSNSYH